MEGGHSLGLHQQLFSICLNWPLFKDFKNFWFQMVMDLLIVSPLRGLRAMDRCQIDCVKLLLLMVTDFNFLNL